MTSQEIYSRTKRRRSQTIDYQMVFRWNRQPDEQWKVARERIWQRDRGCCQSPLDAPPKKNNLCLGNVALKDCHIDHIKPLSSGGSNHARNLRTLCPVCHGLRSDEKHRALTTNLVKKGQIPVNWKNLTWL